MTPPRVDQAAQRLAAENGVDTSHLHGTGPDGEVTVRDVLEQLARLRPAASPQLPALPLTRGPSDMTRLMGFVALALLPLSLSFTLIGTGSSGHAPDAISIIVQYGLPLALSSLVGGTAWSLLTVRVTLTKEGLASRWVGRERYVRWADLTDAASPIPPFWYQLLVPPHMAWARKPDLLLHVRSPDRPGSPAARTPPKRFLVPVSLCRDAELLRATALELVPRGAAVVLL